MDPLAKYIELCRTWTREDFCRAYPHPFLLYSVVQGGGRIRPAQVSSTLTIDRLVIEENLQEQIPGDGPEEWYLVYELVPRQSGSSVLLGCSPACDVQLSEASVSRRHAVLEKRDGAYFISDVDSSAGTAVGGELLEPHVPVRLSSGTRVSLGNVDVVFKLPGDFYDFARLFVRPK